VHTAGHFDSEGVVTVAWHKLGFDFFFPVYFCNRWLAFSSGVETASGGAVKLWIKNAIV
jgi:hypothetical protein